MQMEDKVRKYGHQDTMDSLNNFMKKNLEDPTSLKLQKYKLIIEKSMKYPKMQKLPHSDNLHHISPWDVLLIQSKYYAIDFNEERKWKKSISCIMANKIAAKIKRKKSNKKIDDLYQECLCIYFSISINNTVTDITLPNDNRNKNDQLNLFLKKNNNLEYLSNEFVKWKGSINELKARLTKKFGEKNITKAEKFLKVLKLIENIISIQEDTAKRYNTTKVHEEEMNMNKDPVNLSDFTIVFESSLNTPYQDHHICTEYAENSNLDYNKLNNEITMLIDEITNEINEATNDAMVISNDQLTSLNGFNHIEPSMNFDSTTITSLLPRGGNTAASACDISSNSTTPISNSNNTIERFNKSEEETENDILGMLNPNKLFFSIQDFSLSTKDIKVYFEKLFKTEKFDVLPKYNYRKMLVSTYDINTPEYDFENVYFKVFPPIYYNDSSFKNKILLDKEIESHQIKGKKKKTQKDIEAISQYEKITSLQKITYIWGTSLYGTNLYIINVINNIFEFSHNVKLENEEINYIIENILDEINIDLFGSNLNLLSQTNYTKISNLIEPSIQIGATSNFNYNSQLSDYIKGNITTLKSDKGIKEKYYLINYSFGNVLRNQKEYYSSLSFMIKNPLYKTYQKKRKITQDLKRQLLRYCDKIEELNTKRISKYDYYNMTKNEMSNKTVTIAQISNKINSSLSYEMNNGDKNDKLNKDNLLKQFSNTSSVEMNIKVQTEKVLDSTQLKLQEIVNVISFYSKDEIESEWKAMRTPWYQNNTEFRPKPKKPQIPNTSGGGFPSVNQRLQYFPNQYHPNPSTATTISSNLNGHYSNYF